MLVVIFWFIFALLFTDIAHLLFDNTFMAYFKVFFVVLIIFEYFLDKRINCGLADTSCAGECDLLIKVYILIAWGDR